MHSSLYGASSAKNNVHFIDVEYSKQLSVATLTLGLQPRQGLAKLRAKSEARESHLMLPRV